MDKVIRGWRMYWRSYSSVHFSCLVMSDSLRLHGLQHTRLPCLSSTPGAYSNSYPLSQWYHPTISSSVVPFSSQPQSFPASGSFPVSQLFISSGQSIGGQYEDSFKNLGIKWPNDPTVLLVGIFPEKTMIEQNTCTPMFIATLLTKARTIEAT